MMRNVPWNEARKGFMGYSGCTFVQWEEAETRCPSSSTQCRKVTLYTHRYQPVSLLPGVLQPPLIIWSSSARQESINFVHGKQGLRQNSCVFCIMVTTLLWWLQRDPWVQLWTSDSIPVKVLLCVCVKTLWEKNLTAVDLNVLALPREWWWPANDSPLTLRMSCC